MAGLEMETSKAEPADRNQAKAKLNRDAYVENFHYVESYVDNNPYVGPAWTEMLTWSPAVLTISVVKKRCISRSAKQKMQSAVASIHQLQAISCCKQKSRPAVDTTGGSATLTSAESAVEQRTVIQL
ncbi:pleiotropic drug resistance protein 4-like [Dorcoceras hygrometricum]|uniref:Pleiotropic drug resistance protein 4-like n=1 Tax=Dorcoceras hygrometricum TaxID=472368 RepID=A0A2Z7CP54_9LAMI|nr:pleiotropic drug resistance protein 4-like [Dorcoceras hygrometricum]